MFIVVIIVTLLRISHELIIFTQDYITTMTRYAKILLIKLFILYFVHLIRFDQACVVPSALGT